MNLRRTAGPDLWSVELTLTCEPEKFELCQGTWDQSSGSSTEVDGTGLVHKPASLQA